MEMEVLKKMRCEDCEKEIKGNVIKISWMEDDGYDTILFLCENCANEFLKDKITALNSENYYDRVGNHPLTSIEGKERKKKIINEKMKELEKMIEKINKGD